MPSLLNNESPGETVNNCIFRTMDFNVTADTFTPEFATFSFTGCLHRGEPDYRVAMQAASDAVGPFNYADADIASVRHHRHGRTVIHFRNAARLRFKAWQRAFRAEYRRLMFGAV